MNRKRKRQMMVTIAEPFVVLIGLYTMYSFTCDMLMLLGVA